MANARVHGTTQAIPAQRWKEEVQALLPEPAAVQLPMPPVQDAIPPIAHRFAPVRLHHPLSVYDALLAEETA